MVTDLLAGTAGAPVVADPFAAVDADLQALEGLPAADQAPVFDRIHRALTATLAGSSTGQASSPSGRAVGGNG